MWNHWFCIPEDRKSISFLIKQHTQGIKQQETLVNWLMIFTYWTKRKQNKLGAFQRQVQTTALLKGSPLYNYQRKSLWLWHFYCLFFGKSYLFLPTPPRFICTTTTSASSPLLLFLFPFLPTSFITHYKLIGTVHVHMDLCVYGVYWSIDNVPWTIQVNITDSSPPFITLTF